MKKKLLLLLVSILGFFTILILLSFIGIGIPELMVLLLLITSGASLAIPPYVILKGIPIEARKIRIGHVFLLLVPPIVPIVNFFIHPKIASSVEEYAMLCGTPELAKLGSSYVFLVWSFCISFIFIFLFSPFITFFIGYMGFIASITIANMISVALSLILFTTYYAKTFILYRRLKVIDRAHFEKVGNLARHE